MKSYGVQNDRLKLSSKVFGLAAISRQLLRPVASGLSIVFALLALIVVPVNQVSARNLIQNGGFEVGSGQATHTGSQSGTASPADRWNIETNAVIGHPTTVTATIVSNPRTEGFQAISVQAEGPFDGIFERFSAEDTLISSLSADVFVQTGQIYMILFSSSGLQFIDTATSSGTGAWQTMTLSLPVGTKGGLVAFYAAQQFPANFVVDNVRAIGAIPETTTWTMIIIGFLLMGAVGRLKRSALA